MDKTLAKMIRKISLLRLERLKEALDYDPKTGEFRWKKNIGRAKKGDRAGFDTCGYIRISIDGVKYQAHLLAWMLMMNKHPTTFIDHHDGNGLNNCWKNLRAASRAQNNRNSKVRSTSKIGIKGVQRHRSGKFTAKIQFNKEQHYLGLFDTAEEAGKAYEAAAKRFYGEFAHP